MFIKHHLELIVIWGLTGYSWLAPFQAGLTFLATILAIIASVYTIKIHRKNLNKKK